jgi:hypothetical protein
MRLQAEHITRIAREACKLQGLPEAAYDKLPQKTRDGYERGAAQVIRALDSLGFAFEVPPGW